MFKYAETILKFNKVWTCIRASEAQEKPKNLVEDMKKDQSEVNTLDQKRISHLKATLAHHAVNRSQHMKILHIHMRFQDTSQK